MLPCLYGGNKEHKGINTVKFFPPICSDPLINEKKQIGLLLDDLVSIISKPTRTIPSIMYGSELNNALYTMQRLMCKDATVKQRYVGINKEEQRVEHVRKTSSTYKITDICIISDRNHHSQKVWQWQILQRRCGY